MEGLKNCPTYAIPGGFTRAYVCLDVMIRLIRPLFKSTFWSAKIKTEVLVTGLVIRLTFFIHFLD